MKRKEYIEKLTNLIVNRVKFHAPKARDEDVDYSILRAVNIEEKYPIFLFSKSLNNLYFKAFLAAQKRCKFNFILTAKPIISKAKQRRLENLHIFDESVEGSMLINMLKRLNINYASTIDFVKARREEYIALNNRQIPLDFVPFYYHKKVMNDGAICNLKQFLLNGKNYVVELLNTRASTNTISFEINIPLPLGYYSFKRFFNHIKIVNLTSKERAFFNFFVKDAQVEFSCMDGIENCTHSCVNMRGEIKLKPKQKKVLFFNFGQEKFNLVSPKEISCFFELSQDEMFNIFDVKVLSKDQKFDFNFNNAMPKKIWDAWNNFSCDYINEEKWLSIRAKLVKNQENGIEILNDEMQLKEVQLYHNHLWKRIFVMYGETNYLFAGKVKYYNFTTLTKEIFDKNNEIYLSFAT